jgi:hypothetical protein
VERHVATGLVFLRGSPSATCRMLRAADQGFAKPWSGYVQASWLVRVEESSLASRLWLLL